MKKVIYLIISLILAYFLVMSVIHKNYMGFALFSSAIFLLLILFSHTEKTFVLSLLFYIIAIIIFMQFNKPPIEFMLNLKISLKNNLPIANTICRLIKFSALVMIITLSGIKIISFFNDKQTLRIVDIALSFNLISGIVSLILVIDGTVSSFHFKIITFALSIFAAISLMQIILKENSVRVKTDRKKMIKYLAIISPFALTILIHALFYPELYWDSLVYGVNLARIFVKNNKIPLIAGGPSLGIEWSANYPPGYQLLLAYIFSFTGISTQISRMLSLIFSFTAIIIQYEISKEVFRKELPRTISLITLISTPLFILFSRYSMFYIYLLSQEAAMMYFLYQYIKKQKDKFLYIASIFAGLSMLSSYLGFVTPIVIMVTVIFFSKSQKRLQNLLISMFFSSMIVMPWLMRNYILLGNPIWPFGGGKYIDPIIYKNTNIVQEKMASTLGFDTKNPIQSFYRFLFLFPDYFNGIQINGLKPIMTFFALPAIIISFMKKERSMMFFSSILIINLIVYFAILRWFERYLIGAIVPSAILTGWLIGEIIKNLKQSIESFALKVIVVILLSIIYSSSFIFSLNWDECHTANESTNKLILKNLGNYSFILQTCYRDSYLAWKFISQNITNGTILTNDIRWYYMNASDIHDIDTWQFRELYHLNNYSSLKVKEVLCKNNISYLYLNKLDSSIILPSSIIHYVNEKDLDKMYSTESIEFYKIDC